MRKRDQLAWRLSAVVLVIVSVVILGNGLLGNLLSQRYALDAARNVMEFNSASISSGISELMMSDNVSGVVEFIDEMSRRSSTYHDISLVSHPSGTVTISGLRVPGSVIERSERPCLLCHTSEDLPTATRESRNEVTAGPGSSRILQVATPILNSPSCRTANCHNHTEAGAVLGFLSTEYSLASFDRLMTGQTVVLGLGVLVAMGLSTGALLWMFRRFLATPLRRLMAGVDTLADGELGFRFPAVQKNEIGLVEDSFNDMAYQIQAHQLELQKARDYLEGIVENTADIVITVNTRGLIQTFNRGAEEALGYDRGELFGQRVEILFDDPQERDIALARLGEKDNVTNWETRLRTKDGHIRHVLLTLSRLRNREGELIGTLGISKDITLEKELQKKLIQSESAAAIGRAVTGIQHAIKNMLNTLRGGLYIVGVGRKNQQPQQIDEGCEMIEEGLTRINDLAQLMLKYSREWKVEPEPVDLADLLEKISLAVNQTARERGVTLRREVDGSLPDVPCDPRLMHMGLMDIVSNALDAVELKEYAGDDPPVVMFRLTRAADGKSAVVEIEDNGAGMTKEVIDNVFTPFFTTKKKTGTGLGLALTSRIIELHDGRIEVESEPGEGTVFRITLPLAQVVPS
ncbi:MAG: ATP-binding protein [bacterium]